MNILALESSSPVLSVALKKGAEEMIEAKIEGYLQHAENLMPLLDRLLRKKKLSAADLDIFLIGRGPGSFTGLRIGFATLKGFLVLKPRPCFGSLSLDLIAENAALPEGSNLCVCLDARLEKIYFRSYQRRQNFWRPIGKAQTLPFPELLDCLPDHSFMTGDALNRYQSDFENATQKKKLNLMPEKFWYPSASTLISFFGHCEPEGRSNQRALRIASSPAAPRNDILTKLEKPADFIPLYFRLPEAEEKRKSYALTS